MGLKMRKKKKYNRVNSYYKNQNRIFGGMKINDCGCWEFAGSKVRGGYGRITIGKRKFLAHRVSYGILVGKIPNGMDVLHHCDNPSCINPKHLFLGTDKDNVADCIRKGRQRNAYGEKCHFAKLTANQVREIRKIYKKGKIGCTKIGRIYGMSRSAILLIVKRIKWKHIK